MSNNKKVVVGMSGGVDSTVAMLLLKKQGYEPVGVSLKYNVWQDDANKMTENVCCSAESFEIARYVCEKLDCEYYVIDSSDDFEKEVVGYFKSELKAKRTPNPCVMCNRVLKFKELLKYADDHNIKYVATGHYAKVENGKLMRAKDTEKDQTYTLSFLKREWLPRILFPLGDYTKQQSYDFVKEAGFTFYEKQKQSQDFCFINTKAMKTFLEKEIVIEPGEIKDEEGNVLGEHQGLHFYTIGQRKGLEIPNGPYFVTSTDPESNTLIVCKEKENKSLYKSEITLSPVNFLIDPPQKEMEVEAKIRYRQDPAPAVLYPAESTSNKKCHRGDFDKNEKNSLKLIFAHPQRAVTSGQYAVMYDGDVCVGSGRIE